MRLLNVVSRSVTNSLIKTDLECKNINAIVNYKSAHFEWRQVGVRGGAVAPGGHPRGRHFCPCIIFSALIFLYVVASLFRSIGIFCFCAVFLLLTCLKINPPPSIRTIRTVLTWNPCSPYTVVTLVAPALPIFIDILLTGATDIK